MNPWLAEQETGSLRPTVPSTIAESGLPVEFITELVLKALHRSIELSGLDISRRVGLNFSIVEPSLEHLKAQHLCEIVGGPALGRPSFRYRLTEQGHTQAINAFARNQYSGVAPVPLAQYRRYTYEFQASAQRTVTARDVRAAFSHLVVDDRVLDEIGPAVNSRHSIFLYGPPGNGKTAMAHAIRGLLPGTVSIPYALEAHGHIIRVFDPALHEPVAPVVRGDADVSYDRRWVECRRPLIAVGGELTLDALAIRFDPRSGIDQAPIQTLANCGVLLIDEFGRQRCQPRELLNWWMVPLESGVEYLALNSGEKIEMPFYPLVIFATNLKPSDLVDEAFLRRIRYKVYAQNPTPDEFARIFERCCAERNVPFDPALVTTVLEDVYKRRGLSIRACHARDLIAQAVTLAEYRGASRELTVGLLREACDSYFIEDHPSEPERT